MKKILSLCTAIFLISLSACAVRTPAGSVVIDPDGHHHDHDRGGFCPPGQAKKGHC